ncbi:hypothetical protein C8R47DRAFT_575 [Mycena vitilis]|nr:hypothetical protein C8R47DRAFT_575 [Mycena vitilis]
MTLIETPNVATDKPEADGFSQMMRDKPEEVLSSYKSRTAKEIVLMAEVWKQGQDNGVARSPEGLLQTFLHHLDGKKVPKAVKLPTENDLSDRAWAALTGLEGGFTSQFSAHPELRAKLISAWPGIFKWCRYFHDQRVKPERDSEKAQSAISTISTTIRGLYIDAELRARIRATVGIVTLCTSLCLHPGAPMSAFIPFSLLHTDTWDDMEEIVAAAGGKPEAVAKALLGRLKITINKSPINVDQACTLVFLLTTLTKFPGHALTFTILADNAAWVVSRMLFLVSQVIDAAPEKMDTYLPCIRGGLTFLRGALVRYDSPRLVSQAIDAGLLQTICVLSPLLKDGDSQSPKQSLRFLLRDVLPKSMMFRSVIKVMKREHKEIDPDDIDETIMRSYLREEWMSWVLLLYLRLTIAKFPKEVRGKAGASCDSVACAKRGQKSEFLRCTGCLYVYYCSKACQKVAWPIHREMCKLKKSSKATGGSPMFSDQDAQFLREVISTDAQIHLPHLRKLAARRFPAEPVENHIICVDYTNPLYPAGTCSLKNIKTYVFPPVSDEAADPANVQAQNAEMIKMVRGNPREYTFIEATFAHGEERLTRNLMMRLNMWLHPAQEQLHSALNWQNNKCKNQDGPTVGLLELFSAMNVRYADL